MRKLWFWFCVCVFSLNSVSACLAGLTYSDVVALIEDQAHQGKNPANSIDELLPRLPSQYREHFTFVFSSRSSQGASPANPRVIAFDERLVMTWNGSADQKGFNNLEFIEYRPKSRDLEFRFIRFPSPGDVRAKPIYSEANPAECRSCHEHGQILRPNWSAYNRWPGVFGSDDDNLVERVELANFLNFKNAAPNNPRYSSLRFKNSPIAPYQNDTGDFAYRPNLLLTKLLNRFNVNQAAKTVSDSKLFYKYGSALLSQLLLCDLDQVTAAKLASEITLDLDMQNIPETQANSMAHKLMLVLGIDPGQPGLEFMGRAYDYFDGSSSFSVLLAGAILKDLATLHPDLENSVDLQKDIHQDRYGPEPFYKLIDQLGIPAITFYGSTTTSEKNTCERLLSNLKQQLFLTKI